jgi:hypothetical protein
MAKHSVFRSSHTIPAWGEKYTSKLPWSQRTPRIASRVGARSVAREQLGQAMRPGTNARVGEKSAIRPAAIVELSELQAGPTARPN